MSKFKLNQLVSAKQLADAGFVMGSEFDLPIAPLRQRIRDAEDVRDFCAALAIASNTVMHAHFVPVSYNTASGSPRAYRVAATRPKQKRFEFALPIRDDRLFGAKLNEKMIEALNQFGRANNDLLPLMYQFTIKEPVPDEICVMIDSCQVHLGSSCGYSDYGSGIRFTVVSNIIEVLTNSSLIEV